MRMEVVEDDAASGAPVLLVNDDVAPRFVDRRFRHVGGITAEKDLVVGRG